MTNPEQENWKFTKKDTAISILMFILSYAVSLGIVVLLMIFYDPRGWMLYVQENLKMLIYMVVCIFLIFVVIYCYYRFENPKFITSAKNIALLFTILNTSVVASALMGQWIDIYARPVALLALLALLLLSRRDAIFLNFIFAILMYVMDTYTNFQATETNAMYSSLMVSFIAGIIAIFIGSHIKTRLKTVLLGILITIPIDVIIAMLELSELAFEDMMVMLGYGLVGGMSSTIFFLALLPIFESVFNVLTDFRVRELTSPDAKVMKMLRTEAPGTFNHSMIVAQLAEICAASLNENVELARAAAFYHDVGKLSKPECFTENQSGYNMHDELSPELSADIIRSHAKEGYDLILAHHLPKFFADVAIQHHGTMPIKYFYYKAKRLSDGEIRIEDYSYTGPKPNSKIAAIIMIADASEAACRSLSDRSPDSVERVVRQIIEERIDLDQFSECDITMRELTIIKKTIVASLSGVYHHRVKYPPIQFSRDRSVREEEK